MCGAMLLLAAVTAGIDAGWQPLPDGGMEYIIQIEPHALESLAAGEEVVCEMPPGLKGVTSYRVRVGTGALPREEPPEPNDAAEATPSGSPTDGPVDPLLAVEPHSGEQGTALSPWLPESAGDFSRPESADVPRPLAVVPESTPSPERLAVYDQQEPSAGTPEATPGQGLDSSDQATSKPWLPFTLAVAALFGAVGGMLYTGWIAWEYRRRYQSLVNQVIEAGGRPPGVTGAPESPAG